MLLEVCVDSVESCLAAAEGGASRLEVCSALSEGGLTPTVGMLTVARRRIAEMGHTVQLFAMIRPRRGDFLYSNDDIQSMILDIDNIKQSGTIDGFVFGCLTDTGFLDVEANSQLIKAAAPLPCTLHRAFDVSAEALTTAEKAVELGFSRVLSSGQRRTALEGVELLAQLREKFEGKQREGREREEREGSLVVLAGVGVNEKNAEEIVRKTGVKEVHSSASVPKQSAMKFKIACTMSSASSDEFVTSVADAGKVRRILDAAIAGTK